MRCCLLDLRLSALLCAGFSLPGLAEQDGRSVLTYPALLETVLSAADAIGAGPSVAPLRGLCGLGGLHIEHPQMPRRQRF